jgi:hypothetical protein
VKQNKKAKICFVICFAGKKKLLFYIYAVIVKQKIYKRSSNYYWSASCLHTHQTNLDGFVKDEQNVGVWQPSLLPLNLLNVWLVPGQDTRVTHDIKGNREIHAPCELAPARVRKYRRPQVG